MKYNGKGGCSSYSKKIDVRNKTNKHEYVYGTFVAHIRKNKKDVRGTFEIFDGGSQTRASTKNGMRDIILVGSFPVSKHKDVIIDFYRKI